MSADRLTYPHRHRGLDHDWFSYQPTLKRPPLIWPNGKRVALWVTVPIEFFPLDAPAQPVRPLGALDRGYPDFWSYSNRDYGARIGIYRIMRVLDGLDLRATVAVNAEAATRYPRVIDEILRRRWEIAASGIDMGQLHHGGLSLEHERNLICRARETLVRASGERPAGWHSPGHSQSANTLSLLAEAGFEYVADWPNDDLPYMMQTPAGPLCAMPLTHEWSDRFLLVQHNLTVEDYEAQVLQAFQSLDEEARRHRAGRILSLSISPWILGYPHRIGTLEHLLGKLLDAGSIWCATGIEIFNAFKVQTSNAALVAR